MAKSRILVVGATGDLGKYLVRASTRQGHPTFVLVRPSAAPAAGSKKELLDSFLAAGATPLHADLDDSESLVAALKQVDVVISALGAAALLDGQLKLIEAIVKAGNIKRFVPSEYGNDVDRAGPDEHPILQAVFTPKRVIRKAVREAGLPHTLVCNSAFAEFLISSLAQVDVILSGDVKPPRESITIFGSGEGKIVTSTKEDIAEVTIRAVDDARTLNKKLVIRPPANTLPFLRVVELWEKKLGRSLRKSFVSEADAQKQIQELSMPASLLQALFLTIVSGDQVFPLGPGDADANELYPDYAYVTVDKFLDQFV